MPVSLREAMRETLAGWAEDLPHEWRALCAGVLLGFDLAPADGLLRIRVKDAASFYPAWTNMLLQSGVEVFSIRSQSRSLQNIFERVTA